MLIVIRAPLEVVEQVEAAARALPPDQDEITIGRGAAGQTQPDLDLGFESSVSRRHARVWRQDGRWWIEDVGSKHDTFVAGVEIRGKGPISLEPGVEIQIQSTVLALAPPHWHHLRRGSLVLDLECAPVLSASLQDRDLPFVSRLVVRNWGIAPWPGGELRVQVSGCGATNPLAAPSLPPGECVSLTPVDFHFDQSEVEDQVEPRRAPLHVLLDGQRLDLGDLTCWALAYNEWPYAPEYWRLLSRFSLPNHPLVEQLAHDAGGGSGEPTEALRAVHEHLAIDWRLEYRYESPHWNPDTQKIRLPHQVLLDPVGRTGHGTCLDLALLFSGCLEQLACQPLVAIIQTQHSRHALVGGWRRPRTSLLPVVTDPSRVSQGAHWVDPAGCARREGPTLSFAEATETAHRLLAECRLLFALDVAAARRCGVLPLPFAGEPKLDDQTTWVLARGQEHARAVGPHPCGTRQLLIGLLSLPNGSARRLFAQAGLDPDAALHKIEQLLQQRPGGEGDSGQFTGNSRKALTLARERAKRHGSPLVTERHLLLAVLETAGEALEDALRKLGTSRLELLDMARAMFAGGTLHSSY